MCTHVCIYSHSCCCCCAACVRFGALYLSLIHISEPTRQEAISYAVFCLKKKNTKSHQTLKKHTMKYIHSSPATATTSRRRAGKHVPLVSPYSHSSSIDPGFVEIGLACVHTYVYTRNAAAAAAPPVYVLVLYTIFWPAQFRLSLP